MQVQARFKRPAAKKLSEQSATIEAAVAIACQLENIESYYDEKTLNAAASEYPYGIGIREILEAAARSNGHEFDSRELGSLLRAAFTPSVASQYLTASSSFSTISVPGILSNVANKFLIEGFNSVESGWKDIASAAPVKDFKQATYYSMTGNATYEKVGPSGEIKSGTLGEQSYTAQADTYAKMLTITRRDLINDDMGAIATIPRKLGRGAALALNQIFWTTFLSSVGTFWTSGRGNLITGGSSALSATSLGTATSSFRRQTDPDSNPLGVEPAILLVPPELEIAASVLMGSTLVNTGGASTETAVANANYFKGKYKLVTSAYLSSSSVTNYSTTAWYLLADPKELPVITIAFLGGREVPSIETANADFNTLGISIRGVHDFGVGLQEYRGSVRSDGA